LYSLLTHAVLGAALAAGLGIGFWTEDDLFNNHGFSTTIFMSVFFSGAFAIAPALH